MGSEDVGKGRSDFLGQVIIAVICVHDQHIALPGDVCAASDEEQALHTRC
jgi:hypothetical protein